MHAKERYQRNFEQHFGMKEEASDLNLGEPGGSRERRNPANVSRTADGKQHVDGRRTVTVRRGKLANIRHQQKPLRKDSDGIALMVTSRATLRDSRGNGRKRRSKLNSVPTAYRETCAGEIVLHHVEMDP